MQNDNSNRMSSDALAECLRLEKFTEIGHTTVILLLSATACSCMFFWSLIFVLVGLTEHGGGIADHENKVAMTMLGGTAIAVCFSFLFGIVLIQGISDKRDSYIKCWLAYYIISYFGACFNVACIAQPDTTFKITPFLVIFGLGFVGWPVANIWLDIQERSESHLGPVPVAEGEMESSLLLPT